MLLQQDVIKRCNIGLNSPNIIIKIKSFYISYVYEWQFSLAERKARYIWTYEKKGPFVCPYLWTQQNIIKIAIFQ